MNLSILNIHLQPFKLELVCQACEVNRQLPAVAPMNSTRVHRPSKTRKKKIRKNVRPSKTPSSPTKPSRPVKQSNALENGDKVIVNTRIPRDRLLNSHSRNELILSPIRGNIPPNLNSNLNTRLKLLDVGSTSIKYLFEEIMATPQKIAEVHLASNHKNPNVLNIKFQPQIFSTADPKLKTGEADGVRDLSLDSTEKQKFVNLTAFSNVPSSFQSPFLPGRPIGEDTSPSKSVGFERLGDHLEFLDNPFFEDFE
jgi:hypothetical protein